MFDWLSNNNQTEIKGGIREGKIGEGGYEEIILCETCRFTVPPAVAILNY